MLRLKGSGGRLAVLAIAICALFAGPSGTASGAAEDHVPGSSWSGVVVGEYIIGAGFVPGVGCLAGSGGGEDSYCFHGVATLKFSGTGALTGNQVPAAGGPIDGLGIGCGSSASDAYWERCYVQGYDFDVLHSSNSGHSRYTGSAPALQQPEGRLTKLPTFIVRFQQPPSGPVYELMELQPYRCDGPTLFQSNDEKCHTAFPEIATNHQAVSADPATLRGQVSRGVSEFQDGSTHTGTYVQKWSLTRYPDSDRDGVPNFSDNCPNTSNPWQEDANGDGSGDACNDSDGDGIGDDADNCPSVANPGQEGPADPFATPDSPGGACTDTDNDGQMDADDPCPLDPENGCGVGPPPPPPPPPPGTDARCKQLDVAWRAGPTGQRYLEFGMETVWCSDGTKVWISKQAAGYGDVLPQPLLQALTSVFDVEFKYTGSTVSVAPSANSSSVALTAGGSFQLCGSIVPVGGLVARFAGGPIRLLAQQYTRVPASLRRFVAAQITAAAFRFYLTVHNLRHFRPLTARERETIRDAIALIIDTFADDVTPERKWNPLQPACAPAWDPEIEVFLDRDGTSTAAIKDELLWAEALETAVGVTNVRP